MAVKDWGYEERGDDPFDFLHKGIAFSQVREMLYDTNTLRGPQTVILYPINQRAKALTTAAAVVLDLDSDYGDRIYGREEMDAIIRNIWEQEWGS